MLYFETMVFMDRGRLTFDLVTRLSQLLQTGNNSDEVSSNRIIKCLFESCRFLHGDCRLLSTLEQSTIILLLSLVVKKEEVRLKLMPPLMQMLSAISANSLVWSENFESDFGETFLIQLLKCDASSRLFGMNAVSEFLGQLEILISTANSSTEPLKQILTIRGMFRVIELAPQHLWINHLRNIIDFSKKAIRCVLIVCDIFICTIHYFSSSVFLICPTVGYATEVAAKKSSDF